ncbi:MAG: DNA-3-methyladenine glycosylase [Bdellovibrio sp. 28-41-41]|nr:MAG: DNA-3-methyladenine glycosylase [Bdellovibrio sp. 28-41-41]
MKKQKKVDRCEWANSSEMMANYHDTEWGLPTHSDRQHYEFLILEGAQAGLSWATILKRRKGYEKAFAKFDPKKVAKYTKAKINSLLKDEGIIRNRLKVESTVHNAKLFLDIQKEFGSFDKYAWQFVGGKQINRKRKGMGDLQATSPESDAFSKDLKKRGFKFVGSTVIYAHMQAVGMINDHTIKCFRHKDC